MRIWGEVVQPRSFINFHSFVVNVAEIYVNIKNSPFFPRIVFMCFLYAVLTIAIIYLNNINRLAFVI